MAKFKVKQGVHIDETGTSYKKGSVVETDHDLLALFPEKFEKLHEEEEEEDETPEREEAPAKEDDEAPAAPTRRARRNRAAE